LSGLNFLVPEEIDFEETLQFIAEQFGIVSDQEKRYKISYFDTFDWRLFQKGFTLCQTDKNLFLKRVSDGEETQRIACDIEPVFAQDIPDGALNHEVAAIIEMRALIKHADFTLGVKNYRILNDDQKTVARMLVEKTISDEQIDTSTKISLIPIRGYFRFFRDITNILTKKGFIESSYQDIFIHRLKNQGIKIGAYSSKLDFKLDPQMPADEATKVILRFLLEVIKQNEEGIKEDIDTEFLHDFRVAIRRTRSALGQIPSVLPHEISDRFQNDFATLGNMTNELRDLDVYLLSEARYKAMLPEFLQTAIEPMFDYLRSKRSAALNAVREGLASNEYATILRDWEAFLNQPDLIEPIPENAEREIKSLASERIDNRYRRVTKTGQKALQIKDEELLHKLRIDCKKLRYLLEFFSSLYPQNEINKLIGQLKILQDNLGEFHDLVIQQEYLLHISDQLTASGKVEQITLLSIGSLIGSFEDEKLRVKNEFAEIFKHFISKENRALFKTLFRIEENS